MNLNRIINNMVEKIIAHMDVRFDELEAKLDKKSAAPKKKAVKKDE